MPRTSSEQSSTSGFAKHWMPCPQSTRTITCGRSTKFQIGTSAQEPRAPTDSGRGRAARLPDRLAQVGGQIAAPPRAAARADKFPGAAPKGVRLLSTPIEQFKHTERSPIPFRFQGTACSAASPFAQRKYALSRSERRQSAKLTNYRISILCPL